MSRMHCYTRMVDGEPVTYRADKSLDESEIEAFTALIRAAKARFAEEEAALTPEQRAERETRRQRLRARVDRFRGEA